MELKKIDSLRQRDAPNSKHRVAKWASAAALGLYSFAGSQGQFLNLDIPIPLVFTI
ncbi:hypothetical protein KKB44_02530 [Candidatus Micrarchaeota archaeon]|nr:hypothetical protein [Candidatus Micrarchaeota archaeon]